MLGDALLDPTIIYSKLIQDLFSNNVDLHYMVNITGHGWRKIMRAEANFSYKFNYLPPVPSVLKFMVDKGPISIPEAYGNLNMGAGFAIFVPNKDVEKVITLAKKFKIKAYNSGVVQKGPKRVVIEPIKVTFEGESLQVRS